MITKKDNIQDRLFLIGDALELARRCALSTRDQSAHEGLFALHDAIQHLTTLVEDHLIEEGDAKE